MTQENMHTFTTYDQDAKWSQFTHLADRAKSPHELIVGRVDQGAMINGTPVAREIPAHASEGVSITGAVEAGPHVEAQITKFDLDISNRK